MEQHKVLMLSMTSAIDGRHCALDFRRSPLRSCEQIEKKNVQVAFARFTKMLLKVLCK